jgi:HEAT repeat protein
MNPSQSPQQNDPFQDYDPQACYETLVNSGESIETRMHALLQILQGNSVDALMALLPLFEKSSNLELEVRQAIAIALGEWGSESSTEALLACVDDATEEKSLRLVAFQSLAKTQHAKALARLMLALQDEDNDFFATAADSLEHFGQSVVPELCLMLQQGKTDVQCIAAWHLGKLKNNQAIPHLVKTL